MLNRNMFVYKQLVNDINVTSQKFHPVSCFKKFQNMVATLLQYFSIVILLSKVYQKWYMLFEAMMNKLM